MHVSGDGHGVHLEGLNLPPITVQLRVSRRQGLGCLSTLLCGLVSCFDSFLGRPGGLILQALQSRLQRLLL